ncbi:MAG: hypothetical protein MHM6MM_001705 [Cercozoa sp. M6MM]
MSTITDLSGGESSDDSDFEIDESKPLSDEEDERAYIKQYGKLRGYHDGAEKEEQPQETLQQKRQRERQAKRRRLTVSQNVEEDAEMAALMEEEEQRRAEKRRKLREQLESDSSAAQAESSTDDTVSGVQLSSLASAAVDQEFEALMAQHTAPKESKPKQKKGKKGKKKKKKLAWWEREQPKHGPSCESIVTDTKVEVTEEVDFAGSKVQLTRHVDQNSAQHRKAQALARQKSAIDDVLAQFATKKKATVMDKTRQDWRADLQQEGDEEQLKEHARSDKGFLEQQRFLQRTEQRLDEAHQRTRVADMQRRMLRDERSGRK